MKPWVRETLFRLDTKYKGEGRGREGNWAFSTQKVCAWKDIIKKTKQPETIFPSHTSEMEIVFIIYKSFYNFIIARKPK